MSIKSSFTFDEFCEMLAARNKKVFIVLIVGIVLLVFGLSYLIIGDLIFKSGITSIVFFSALLLASIILGISLFSNPKKIYKSTYLKTLPKIVNGVTYEYEFNDNEFSVNEKYLDSEIKSSYKNEEVTKIVITKTYIYIYVSKNLAYPILLKDVNEEQLAQLKSMFPNKIK